MIWNKMVGRYAETLGISESTARWRLIAAWSVVFVIGAGVGVGLLSLPSNSPHLQAAPTTVAQEPPIHNELKEAVSNAIHDREIGLEAMCEKIYNLTATYDSSPDSMYGTTAAGAERLPAIKMRIPAKMITDSSSS